MSAQTSIEPHKKQSTSSTPSKSNPTAREHKRIFSLCHYLAIMKRASENESRHLGQNEIAGLKGKSGHPGNMNAFKHGLAAIQKRREEGVITEHEEQF